LEGKAGMIDSRIVKLESLMDGILTVEQEKVDALNRIKTWLGEVDRDVEFIPDTGPKRFQKLLVSIKKDQLSEAEVELVNNLFAND